MPQESLSALRSAVADHIDETLQTYRQRFIYVGDEVGDLFDIAGPLIGRGKRLRASFLAAGWRSFGGCPLDAREIRAGAALEFFQLAALVHDDLMDASLSRRGLPAAHLQFRQLHDARGMISKGSDFGSAGALLLGDLLLVMAASEFQGALSDGFPHESSARVIFEEMMAEVTVGQYLDIYAQSAPWADDPAIDRGRAQRVIRAKSARYSVEHPLALGAAMAGAGEQERNLIRAVGLPIGEAFQLRDDVLSVFGDPDVTGKPAGDDLREGKRTVLVTTAIALASPRDVELLKSSLGNQDLTDDDVGVVRGILTSTGAVEHVERLISDRAEDARRAIEALGLNSERAELLHDLAAAAITRQQ